VVRINDPSIKTLTTLSGNEITVAETPEDTNNTTIGTIADYAIARHKSEPAPHPEYALGDELAAITQQTEVAINEINLALNSKQPKNEYLLPTALDPYALKTDLSLYQLKGNYVLISQVKLLLVAPLTLFVSLAGNDATADGTQAAPFSTLLGTCNYIRRKIEQAGYPITIQFADGTYPVAASTGTLQGLENITIAGNVSNPGAVQFSCSSSAAGGLIFYGSRNITLNGIEFLSGGFYTLLAQFYSQISIFNCWFNGAGSVVLFVTRHSELFLNAGTQLRGATPYFINATQQSLVSVIQPSGLSISGTLNFTHFAGCDQSRVDLLAMNITGSLTGSKGLANRNGVLTGANTNLPSTMTAVTVATGGQAT
jgi:hypothetical protein